MLVRGDACGRRQSSAIPIVDEHRPDAVAAERSLGRDPGRAAVTHWPRQIAIGSARADFAPRLRDHAAEMTMHEALLTPTGLLAGLTLAAPSIAAPFKCPHVGGEFVFGQEANVNSLDQMASTHDLAPATSR